MLLPFAILASGLLYIALLNRGPAYLRYVLKPGTMALIILLAAGRAGAGDSYGWLILAGLLLSTAGDIFLMLPSDRFLQGLVAFFAAHLVYVAAFTAAGPMAFTQQDGIELVGLAMVGATMFRRLQPGILHRSGARMLLPVALYIAVISLMVWRALALGVLAAAGGALLFYLSDAILAWNRFVKPLRWGNHAVMATYYAAQFLIALSIGGSRG